MKPAALDLAGVGIGPFNLSLAAQLDGIAGADALFFEQRPAFDWHPGMMLPDVALQTSFLKDLVTATNPTSPWSFIAYLVANKRFYEFLNANFDAIPRREFANYLAWVADGLSSLRFNAAVREIDHDGRCFVLRLDDAEHRIDNLALGIGLAPNIPPCATHVVGSNCFHSSVAKSNLDRQAGKCVAVIGGGQSGAEIVLHLLSMGAGAPQRIDWISQRPGLHPLEETPFTDELFTPQYVERFHSLPEARRRTTVEREKLAGDGVSSATLQAIYRRLYALRHLEGPDIAVSVLPHREVRDVQRQGVGFQLVMSNGFDGGIDIAFADTIVLATGYAFALPDCLAPLRDRLALDDLKRFRVNADFSIKWDGPTANRIFALNAGLHSHGIAEPQLSLMAWRSAVIVNALLGRAHFDIEAPEPIISWATRDERRQSIEL